MTLDHGLTQSLYPMLLGLLSLGIFQIARHVLELSEQRRRWFASWTERLDQLPRSTLGAARGELVCLEGRCGPPIDKALVSPISRATCVSYWLSLRTSWLVDLVYRRRQSVRFFLETDEGEQVLVDPGDAGMIELDSGLDLQGEIQCPRDAELEGHLEALAVQAAEEGLSVFDFDQGRLEPGQRCTVIAVVEHSQASSAASPYRAPMAPVVGGSEVLFYSSRPRRALRGNLGRKLAGAYLLQLTAWAALGYAAGLLTTALVLSPWLGLLPLMIALRLRVAREAMGRDR